MEDVRQKGFTLIELMVAMAISGMLMAVVAMAYTGQSRSNTTVQDVSNLQQDMRSALQLMAREIRMAGYDPTGNANAGITTATATNFRFTEDTGDGTPGGAGDGDLGDANEDIRFAINTNNALGRETGGGGGLQPIAETINQVMFEYYLENKTWTQTPTAAELDKIHAVKIIVLGRSARESAGAGDTTTFIPPLNNPTVNWTPANPGRYHWRMMSLIVQCRNLQIKS